MMGVSTSKLSLVHILSTLLDASLDCGCMVKMTEQLNNNTGYRSKLYNVSTRQNRAMNWHNMSYWIIVCNKIKQTMWIKMWSATQGTQCRLHICLPFPSTDNSKNNNGHYSVLCIIHIHCESKKGGTILLSISLLNIDRFHNSFTDVLSWCDLYS